MELIFYLSIFVPPVIFAVPVYYFFPKLGKLWSYLTALILFFLILIVAMAFFSMRIPPPHTESALPAGQNSN